MGALPLESRTRWGRASTRTPRSRSCSSGAGGSLRFSTAVFRCSLALATSCRSSFGSPATCRRRHLKFEDMPNGLAAAFKMPFVGWSQIIAFAGFVEVTNLTTETRKNAGDYENFGAFGIPFGKGIEDAAKKEKSLLAEINNGRLAMVAIIGMFFQDGLTGSAWGDWALYTASPLRAQALRCDE